VVKENKVLLDEGSVLLYNKLRADVKELILKIKKVMKYFFLVDEKISLDQSCNKLKVKVNFSLTFSPVSPTKLKLTLQFSHSSFTESSAEFVSSSLNPNLQSSAIHFSIPLLSERYDNEDKENELFLGGIVPRLSPLARCCFFYYTPPDIFPGYSFGPPYLP
jgi:hypothetical protein